MRQVGRERRRECGPLRTQRLGLRACAGRRAGHKAEQAATSHGQRRRVQKLKSYRVGFWEVLQKNTWEAFRSLRGRKEENRITPEVVINYGCRSRDNVKTCLGVSDRQGGAKKLPVVPEAFPYRDVGGIKSRTSF